MTLYLLRHGEADWPDWDKPDDERPLTKRGKKEMRRVAALLRELGIKPAVVLSSPLPRAWQTAEIVAEDLGTELREESALGPGFNAARFKSIVGKDHGDDIMIVGHEPSFSTVIRAVTGGNVKLAKAGVARVEVEDDGVTGRLIWLLPPKVANACRQDWRGLSRRE